jgi:hypothetical protein
VQLLLEVLQRVHWMPKRADRERYTEGFAQCLKGYVGYDVYRMKREDAGAHPQYIGEFLQRLPIELQPVYAAEPVYRGLVSVFINTSGSRL